MRTTLDPRLQTAARIALMDGLETYDHRHGWRGAWGRVANAARLAEGGPGPRAAVGAQEAGRPRS